MNIVLFVNSSCNMSCAHCYVPRFRPRSLKNTLAAIKSLRNNGHEITVALSETLLHPEYLEAYQAAGQEYMLTNGVLLYKNKSLYDILQAHGIIELKISAHFGVSKDLKSVPEEIAAEVIKESKRRGFRVVVFTVITADNYKHLEGMCEKSAEYGADILSPIRLVSSKSTGESKKLLTPAQVKYFFRELERLRKKYPKTTLQIKPRGNFGPRPGSKGEELAKKNQYCPAGKEIVVIDPQNNVYGCPFLMQTKNIIGRYKNDSIVIEKDLLADRRNTCIAHIVKK